ncbi:two-component system, chemotaxis family, response regulator CheY [Deferribacter desulfuricans SSM1]|uniref:Two-component system, chemotaxis family, response regulator CheY n=1 Tax=Deferribacter desulfuricans (strain DSM 14783 / JCM 11476 / NBRC 101012 / SSM1) TaxID=639282 RepID=D3PDJ5_DEFDS|nr:response regulator [Deferribacter desulfuricans]BAI80668.1 two-component system, chemotaxis family, response regulator CheY [Deferribacter desulfuricans SSM1]
MAKKILVIDDAVTMRQLVSATLKSAGFDVVDASNGKEALMKLEKDRFNLIITDLNMPIMDGITFIKEVKKNPKYRLIPIIMLTTESGADKKEEGRKAGAKAWIVKPFKPNDLLTVVKKILPF